MKNKFTHYVDMKLDNGSILRGLEANLDDDGTIYFVRDDDGVHAWHCNSVHKDDYNVDGVYKKGDYDFIEKLNN